jgi:hypothetical protein
MSRMSRGGGGGLDGNRKPLQHVRHQNSSCPIPNLLLWLYVQNCATHTHAPPPLAPPLQPHLHVALLLLEGVVGVRHLP